MKSLMITFGSLALTSTVIGNAYYQKKQFYPSVVYLTKSNPSMAIIYLQTFVFVLLMGKLMRKVFFGHLRAAEMEHLIERSWYAVTETCLAFTVFRDDLSPKFVALFTLLLFLKCFHWLAEDRVDYMERSPNISVLFHIRVVTLLILLGSLDVLFVNLAYYSTLTRGASVQLVFGFEYAILLMIVLNIFMKYTLHFLDIQRDNPWENKAVYLLYTELFMGFMKVVLYLTFITIMMKIHTFPLFAIRPMYLSMRSFKKAFYDVIMSRRAIRNMNNLYPNATPEELASVDNVCIICREEMSGNGSSKKLPCNHIFHVACLRSWFQRQQTCPTCRMDVLRAPVATAAPTPNVNPIPNQAQHPQPGQGNAGAAQANLLFAAQLHPLMANFANFVQQQQQRQPQPQSGANQPNVQASGEPRDSHRPNSSEASGTTRVGIPPMMGFPFMPFVPLPPMPLPPANLHQLSLEELRRMEGVERDAIEARLRCLQNIKTLLDAAALQLQQYHSTSGGNNNNQESPFRPSTSATSTSEKPIIKQPPTDTNDVVRQIRLQRFSQTTPPNISEMVDDDTDTDIDSPKDSGKENSAPDSKSPQSDING